VESAIPTIVDGEVRRLDPRYVELQKRVGWITTGVLGALCGIGLPISMFIVRPTLLGFVLALTGVVAVLGLLAWWMQRWPALEYARASYRVDQAGLEIRRGVYWRQVINVPRSRVQHTDVSQGPFERQYGLGTLAIHTAGTEHARVELPGLPHEVALAIRDHLLPRNLIDAI
jgi:membrane protein YdbS with pleckstrin-like domain